MAYVAVADIRHGADDKVSTIKSGSVVSGLDKDLMSELLATGVIAEQTKAVADPDEVSDLKAQVAALKAQLAEKSETKTETKPATQAAK